MLVLKYPLLSVYWGERALVAYFFPCRQWLQRRGIQVSHRSSWDQFLALALLYARVCFQGAGWQAWVIL